MPEENYSVLNVWKAFEKKFSYNIAVFRNTQISYDINENLRVELFFTNNNYTCIRTRSLLWHKIQKQSQSRQKKESKSNI